MVNPDTKCIRSVFLIAAVLYSVAIMTVWLSYSPDILWKVFAWLGLEHGLIRVSIAVGLTWLLAFFIFKTLQKLWFWLDCE